MKVLMLTNEYPPNVYGGAGVHVDYLSRELSRLMEVEVRCFGDQGSVGEGLIVNGFSVDGRLFEDCPVEIRPVLSACHRCIAFNGKRIDADIIHCHTWYTLFGGILARLIYGVPMVLTTHSLEPSRPWKREQLGRAYDFSCWVERHAIRMADAVIAVSEGMRADILRLFDVDGGRVHVIYNGIDTDEYTPTASLEGLRRYGIDERRPYVLFVGRVTRQKGIMHLINAVQYLDPDVQVVLCAGTPDTRGIAEEVERGIDKISQTRGYIFWINEQVDKRSLISLYSHAAVFCCPSIYEPFGIINLEAMACKTPVVASDVGGIKEIVVDGVTGSLVKYGQSGDDSAEAKGHARFSRGLADAINHLIRNPDLARSMADAGRERAEALFSWGAIAKKTEALYKMVIAKQGK